MSTRRLYYEDAYLQRFSAHVITQTAHPKGQAVVLDQSAFYPEGGGQPADTGTLNGVPVIDLHVEGDTVWHILSTALTHSQVDGQIDWGRRFDHMQQHLGQHMLSAALEHLFDFHTLAFHLGRDSVTIDIDTPSLTAEQARTGEQMVNSIIWEARPVLARFVDSEQLAQLTLRKPPSVAGPIRVVSVPDFDHSACGGTHPSTTGGVGMLFIRSWERRGQTTRIEFVCGGRALRDLARSYGLVTRAAGALSTGIDDLEPAIGRLREAEEHVRKALLSAQEQLRGLEAQQLVADAQTIGAIRVVRLVSQERSIEELRALANLIATQGVMAVLGLAAGKGHIILARGAGQPEAMNCATLLRDALLPLGGKGGGRPEQAQGGLADASQLDVALDTVMQALSYF